MNTVVATSAAGEFEPVANTHPIIDYLARHGQRLDVEIAAATGIPIGEVRLSLSQLSARGEVMSCQVIRFTDGKPGDEATLCRIMGSFPPSKRSESHSIDA